jgi:hypothetical protein
MGKALSLWDVARHRESPFCRIRGTITADDRSDHIGARRSSVLRPTQQLRQLGDVGGDPPGFIAGHKIGRRSPARLLLVLDIRERVAVLVLHDEAGIVVVFDYPGWREAAGMIGHDGDLCADDLDDQIGKAFECLCLLQMVGVPIVGPADTGNDVAQA